MISVRPLRSEEDYEAALARIDMLMDAQPDTPEDDEMEVLLGLVERYEDTHYSVGPPDTIAAIEFRMDQAGLTHRDLVPYIGSRAKVSEVLSGKRDVTMGMARALHKHLGIPADVLLQEPGVALDSTFDDIDLRRFPLNQMAKLGWIENGPDLADRAEELIGDLIERAGGREVAVAPLYRKNDHARINAKTDAYALTAWCWQIMAQARNNLPDTKYSTGAVTQAFLRTVAQLSVLEDGPRRARRFLARHGIALEYAPHLRKTHLDGAALRLADGRPVIGLTIRYDRIDNFWFTLLHELAHVGLHLDRGCEAAAFVDDHSLRRIEVGGSDSTETNADRWAEEALIPPSIWEESVARFTPTAMAVVNLASEVGVHPAIVAGRVRYERGNYRLLSQFVGSGQIRRQFE